MYRLYIANKNYSSWSLRPWVLMREVGIPFEAHLVPFGDEAAWQAYRRVSPAGKVPCLVDGDTVVWDSLAITEYLAERHPDVWSRDAKARAWSRSAAAEMHSGFFELRNRCSMNCGVRVRLHEQPPQLAADIRRLSVLWQDGLTRFGGPFLAGARFTAVDAFFAPVAFRFQSYAPKLDSTTESYARRLLEQPAMREWYRSALAETMRDEPHDIEMRQVGTIVEDLRAPAA